MEIELVDELHLTAGSLPSPDGVLRMAIELRIVTTKGPGTRTEWPTIRLTRDLAQELMQSIATAIHQHDRPPSSAMN